MGFRQWLNNTSVCVIRNWKIHRIRPNFNLPFQLLWRMSRKGSECGRIIANKICSSCLRYAVTYCWHLVRAGRRVVTISFVSSFIIQRNMKLFQHWIKWKGSNYCFLHLLQRNFMVANLKLLSLSVAVRY